MFIPQYKLSKAKDIPIAPLAIISQSGAFGSPEQTSIITSVPGIP
jgi:hypothetical protein